MDNHLPTDDEFLDHIYASLADDAYVETVRNTYDAQATHAEDAHFDMLVASGVVSPNERHQFRIEVEESYSLEKAFRGSFIRGLKGIALAVAGSDRDQIADIPVALLPTKELNASAIATPRGGAIIVLNQGAIAQLMSFCRCALAFISWHTDAPFCRDATQDDYAEALIGLAEYVRSSDLKYLSLHKDTLRFPSLSPYHQPTIRFCMLMELFILMHEYGHVVRGHLITTDLRPAFDGQFAGLQEYNKSEEQEFEADEYAIDRITVAGRVRDLRPSDVALGAGLVMKLFELCDWLAPKGASALPRTHPPARDRWNRIKRQTLLLDASGAFAHNLDPAFDLITKQARRPKTSEAPF